MPSRFWGRLVAEKPIKTISEKPGKLRMARIRLLPVQSLLLKKLPTGERPDSAARSVFSCLLKLLEEGYGPGSQEEFVLKLQDWDLRGDNSRILVHFLRQTLNGITKMSQQGKNSSEAVKHQCLTQKALLWLVLMFNAVGQC